MLNFVSYYIKITVPYYIPVAIVATFVGITTSGGIFDFNALLAFLSLSLLVGAFNTFNGIADHRIDEVNKPYRPIPAGKISKKAAFFYAASLYCISLTISSQLGTEFFLIAVLSMVITLFYSIPVVRLKKRFLWSNVAGAVFYGLLCPLAGWSLTPTNLIPCHLIGFLFLLTLSLSITKDFEDIKGDRAYSMETFPIKLGVKGSVLVTSVTLMISFAYMTFLICLNFLATKFVVILLAVPAFLFLIQKMCLKPKGAHQSANGGVGDRKLFFTLIGLGVTVEFLVGLLSIF